ncbi:MAG: DUF1427 family protein [Gammaproteobacteria bacterium]|nr:DUF1427 family protein [Gammaproteobacteria bacterium]
MILKLGAGYLLAFVIGAGCRILIIPSPAPAALSGALLVVALTCGYLVTDYLLQKRTDKS